MSTKLANSGFTNHAGFQWLTSGSRVARRGPAGFLPNIAKYDSESVPHFSANVLPGQKPGRNFQTPRVNTSVALRILGRGDLDLHDRLQDHLICIYIYIYTYIIRYIHIYIYI